MLTSNGEVQHFDLAVTATTTDGTSTAPTSGSIHVDVTPVADAPTLHVADASGNEDSAIALNITSALSEADADAALSITITGVRSEERRAGEQARSRGSR